MMAGMDEDVTLRLVAEGDLAILERLTQDPELTGEYAWLGWPNLTRYRQWFAENRLVSDDVGILMAVRGDDRLGFVSWFKVPTTPAYIRYRTLACSKPVRLMTVDTVRPGSGSS